MGTPTLSPRRNAKSAVNASSLQLSIVIVTTITGTALGHATYTEKTRWRKQMTKDQLRQYRSIKIEICQIERRIVELEHLGQGADIAEPLRDLYCKKLADLIECQLRIEKAIEGLEPIERELMRLRYIDGAEWIDVAEAIHYEWTQTHRIHAKALEKIRDL